MSCDSREGTRHGVAATLRVTKHAVQNPVERLRDSESTRAMGTAMIACAPSGHHRRDRLLHPQTNDSRIVFPMTVAERTSKQRTLNRNRSRDERALRPRALRPRALPPLVFALTATTVLSVSWLVLLGPATDAALPRPSRQTPRTLADSGTGLTIDPPIVLGRDGTSPVTVSEAHDGSPSTVELTGSVVDECGSPIAGVRVFLGDDHDSPANDCVREVGFTGTSGGFVALLQLDPEARTPRPLLCFAHEEFGWAFLRPQVPDQMSLRRIEASTKRDPHGLDGGRRRAIHSESSVTCEPIVLRRGTELRGRIVDESGAPVPGANVASRALGADELALARSVGQRLPGFGRPHALGPIASTDASGYFAVRPLTSRQATSSRPAATMQRRGLQVTAPGFATQELSTTTRIVLADGSLDLGALVLRRAVTLVAAIANARIDSARYVFRSSDPVADRRIVRSGSVGRNGYVLVPDLPRGVRGTLHLEALGADGGGLRRTRQVGPLTRDHSVGLVTLTAATPRSH
jgi:hypothetical protein